MPIFPATAIVAGSIAFPPSFRLPQSHTILSRQMRSSQGHQFLKQPIR